MLTTIATNWQNRIGRMEDFHSRGVETQRTQSGISSEQKSAMDVSSRVSRLREKMKANRVEKTGAGHSDR